MWSSNAHEFCLQSILSALQQNTESSSRRKVEVGPAVAGRESASLNLSLAVAKPKRSTHCSAHPWFVQWIEIGFSVKTLREEK